MSAIMARPGQDPVSKDDIPWWLKFAGRGVGTVGGFSKLCSSILGGIYRLLDCFWLI